jgi:U3 small nucleolar RNA-associated protein 14
MINDRRDAKDIATKKRKSPAKISTKVTPTQKRKKLKHSPANDCAKDSSSSSSSSSTSSSSEEDDDDEDNDTDKEPGNNTDDNDNGDNDILFNTLITIYLFIYLF